jgi:hypothetical protein
MALGTKLRLIKQKFEQLAGDELILSGDTIIDSSQGNIKYSTSSVSITDDAQLVTKKYVDENTSTGITAGTTYNLSSPSTVSVGGINAGTDLLGKTSNEILEEILVPYINPAFSSFSISGQATTIEVGTTLSGTKTFTWGTSTSGNVKANSVDILDVTSGSTLASGLANDGSEALDIGVKDNSSPISQQWRAQAENTNDVTFQSSLFTVSSIYPYFWGTVASGGAAAGDNRPTANQALITGGTKVVSSSNSTITVNFGSSSDDYLWFAIPTTYTSKTVWYIDALNNGSIGGAVSPGGNLFPAFDSVSIDSPTALWNGVTYKIYISNYQSAVSSNMQLRNS